jgi:hypothetical protein
MPYRYGKLPPRRRLSTPCLSDYLAPAAEWPAVPAEGWEAAVPANALSCLGNDQWGNCLVGGTIVDAPDANVGYRSSYDGPIITIQTASGKRLTVTPNHPILTRNGYVPAHTIKHGDNLVSTRGTQILPRTVGSSGSKLNVDYSPALIEEIFSSLLRRRNITAKMMPTPVHFHGDGRFMNGDIDIVNADRFLGDSTYTLTDEPRIQHKIGSAGKLKRSLSSLGSAFHRIYGRGFPASGVMAMSSNGGTLSWSHPLIGMSQGFAIASDRYSRQNQGAAKAARTDTEYFTEINQSLALSIETDRVRKIDFGLIMEHCGLPRRSNSTASGPNPSSDSGSGPSKEFSDILRRFTGFVQLDSVVDVISQTFTGHVFNLSTDEGWYVANGIITHNCAEAGALHLIQAQSYNAGRPLNPTTAECLALYAEVTGFDPSAGPPGDNPTDRGTALEDLLLHWQRVGITVAGQIHKIEGFAALDLASVAQQRYATYLFGGSYLGINCPQRCESDTTNWNFGPGLPIAGGHCVIRAGEGAAGGQTGSWGMWIPTSNLFYRSYQDEAYIVVTPDWLGKQGKSPTGLDLDGLLAAMRQLS